MIHLWSLALLRPAWLLALLGVAAAAWFAQRHASALGDWARVVEPKLLAALSARGGVVAGRKRTKVAGVLVAALTALALTGPAAQRADNGTFRNVDAMVIAMDLSRSVSVGGHLAEARAAAAALDQAAGARQVALVVYAGDAYVAAPFTTDHEALGTTIFALDEQTVPDPGTRATRALALAHRMLRDAHVVQGDVVLISDGGGIGESSFKEAKALASAGYSLETVFVPAGRTLPDTAPKPDSALLNNLAASVSGVSADIANLQPVLSVIGTRPALRLAQGEYSVLAWKDFGRLLIAAAMIPALLAFRRMR